MIALVAATATLAVEAVVRVADRGPAFQEGFAILLGSHLLWVVFMVRLFG